MRSATRRRRSSRSACRSGCMTGSASASACLIFAVTSVVSDGLESSASAATRHRDVRDQPVVAAALRRAGRPRRDCARGRPWSCVPPARAGARASRHTARPGTLATSASACAGASGCFATPSSNVRVSTWRSSGEAPTSRRGGRGASQIAGSISTRRSSMRGAFFTASTAFATTEIRASTPSRQLSRGSRALGSAAHARARAAFQRREIAHRARRRRAADPAVANAVGLLRRPHVIRIERGRPQLGRCAAADGRQIQRQRDRDDRRAHTIATTAPAAAPRARSPRAARPCRIALRRIRIEPAPQDRRSLRGSFDCVERAPPR